MGPPRYGRQANGWKVRHEARGSRHEALISPTRHPSAFLGTVFNIWKKFLGFRSATQGTAAFEPVKTEFKGVGVFTLPPSRIHPFTATLARRTQGYRIKPHGQLVSVSLTCYHASTPDLSTRWSAATLQVTYITGRLILRQVSRLDAFSAYLSRT